MIKYILLALLLSTTAAQAKVKRGTFTSDGSYIMDHQKNDYKSPRNNDYPSYRGY